MTSAVKTMVRCEAVSKTYRRGGDSVPVLEGIDLVVPTGEFLALMGPSGSGKSTLLNLIGGIDRPTSGQLEVAGLRLDETRDRSIAAWRAANVGFVFQFYNLLGVLSAEDNVALPLLLTDLDRNRRRRQTALALSLVGLSERAGHKPGQLSGGQQQRVGIARALVADPALLVCDEPTGDLDRASADEILALLATLNAEHGKTIVMVTHDPKAAAHAGRVLHLDKGRLVETVSEPAAS